MTVSGADRTGIIANVTTKLAQLDINIVDVSQTLMSGHFTMILRVSLPEGLAIVEVQEAMKPVAEATGQVIRINSEQLYTEMHEV